MKALYAGSFDPITFGHMDIIKRAVGMFGSLTIGVADNPNKKGMFDVQERMALIKKAILVAFPFTKPSISVVSISSLTADYARIHGYTHIIKGVRTTQDFDYERLIHEVTLTQQKKLETVLLFSDNRLSHVSSSAAKELARFHGMIQGYVPLCVKAAIEEKLGQVILGVTGEVGSGKSTYCQMAVNARPHDTCFHISLDKIGHRIFTDDNELCKETRKQIEDFFGTCDRKKLGERVFGDDELLSELNSMMHEPMLTLLREELAGKKGTIFLEGALLVESHWLHLCNNNVILLETPNKEEHYRRLQERGLNEEQIKRRIVSQWNFEKKKDAIIRAIDGSKWGSLAVTSKFGTGKIIHKV